MDRFDDDWPEPEDYTPELELRDDPKIDEASSRILHFFDSQPNEVFYEMQLEVIFEDDYFHWITTKALARLRDGDKIHSSIEDLPDVGSIRFYFHRKNRYWKRKASEIKASPDVLAAQLHRCTWKSGGTTGRCRTFSGGLH